MPKKIDQILFLNINGGLSETSKCYKKTTSWVQHKINTCIPKPDVIAFCETKLKSSSKSPEFHNYKCHRLDRDMFENKRAHGGILIYTHQKFNHVRPFLETCTESVEALGLEISERRESIRLNGKECRKVVCVYRRPGTDKEDFYTWLRNLNVGGDLIIFGDVNIDLDDRTKVKNEMTKEVFKINSMLKSLDLDQKVEDKTRVVNQSGTKIDWVLTAKCLKNYRVYVTDESSNISDHRFLRIINKYVDVQLENESDMGLEKLFET